MTIQQIQYILETYRTGSISKAAGNLFLTQPNLSGAIRSLEKELGFPVFIRTNKGITPTEQGLLVLEQAGRISESYEKMLRVADHMTGACVRISGVAYTPVCEAYVKLCQLYQDRERLQFSYSQLPFTEAVEKLYLSLLDFAVVLMMPNELPEAEKLAGARGIALESVCEIPVVLRIGPNHPLYREPEIKLEDFKQYTFVDYDSLPFSQSEELRALLHFSRDRVVLVSDRDSKCKLVADGTMYSIGCKLPDSANRRFGFRNIPLGKLHFLMVFLSQEKKKLPQEAVQYRELVLQELAGL